MNLRATLLLRPRRGQRSPRKGSTGGPRRTRMENSAFDVSQSVTYMPPRDRQTARCKEKARAEEWIKNEDGITETMTGPIGVYTRFVSTSPPDSKLDDA